MNPLYLNFQGVDQVNLSGESDSVIQGCRYATGVGVVQAGLLGTSELISETIELVLGGSESELSAKVLELESFLEVAGNAVIRLDWVYLHFYVPALVEGDPAIYDWRSRVLGGRVELGGKGLVDRDGESQIVKLFIIRQNYWAAPKAKAHTFTKYEDEPNWAHPVIGVSSHHDSGHDNDFGICGHEASGALLGMAGDLASPLEVWIENTYSADALENFTISQRFIRGTGRLDAGFIEAEDMTAGAGVTATPTADAFCSAGNYVAYSWAGSTETQVCRWEPSVGELAIMRGQTHRPIVRLQAVLATTDLWACVKVLDHTSGTVLQASMWMLVPAGSKYIELPAVNIPPALAGYTALRAVDVGLYFKRAGGGTVKIDFVQFTPAERIRHLTWLGASGPVGSGKYLIDSGIEEETYYQDASGNRAATHVGQGEYLQVVPGYDSMVRVLHRSGGDASWLVTVELNIYAWYEPRRRNL